LVYPRELSEQKLPKQSWVKISQIRTFSAQRIGAVFRRRCRKGEHAYESSEKRAMGIAGRFGDPGGAETGTESGRGSDQRSRNDGQPDRLRHAPTPPRFRPALRGTSPAKAHDPRHGLRRGGRGGRHGCPIVRVLDAVGKTTYFRCRRLLKPEGVFAATDLGPWCQNPLLAIWSVITGSSRVIFPLPQSSKGRAFVDRLKTRMEAGEFRPVIDRKYPLEAIADAYRYVETGQKTGIVVINVRSGDQ